MGLQDSVYQGLLRTILLKCTLVELIGRFAGLVLCFFRLLWHCHLSILLLESWKHILFGCCVGLTGVLWDSFKLLSLRRIDHMLLNEACLWVFYFGPQFADFSLIFAEVSAVERLQGLKPDFDLGPEVEVVLSAHCEHRVDWIFYQVEMPEVWELNDEW